MSCRTHIIAIVLIGSAVAASPRAQWIIDRWFTPWLSQAEFERSVDALEFDDESDEAVFRALYEDLLGTYHERSGPIRAAVEGVGDIRAIEYEWRAERRALGARFEADVIFILDPDQRAIWIPITQALRRGRVLPEMERYGASRRSIPDLVAVLEDLDLSETECNATANLARQYGDELDEVLREWENSIDEIWTRWMAAAGNPIRPARPRAAIKPGGSNTTTRPARAKAQRQTRRNDKEVERLHQRIIAMAHRAKEITSRYADSLATHLEDGNRNRFLLRVRTVKYPNVYYRSPIDFVVEAIQASPTVDPGKRELIDAIYVGYCDRREVNRRRMLEAIEWWERPSEAKRHRKRYGQILSEGGDPSVLAEDHPIIEHVYTRRKLVRSALREMRGVFTRAEFEQLPAGVQVLLSWELRISR